MQLPNEEIVPEPPVFTDPTPANVRPKPIFTKFSRTQKLSFAAAAFLVFLFATISLILLLNQTEESKNTLSDSEAQEKLNEAKKAQSEKELREASASSAISKLQSAYRDVIVSDSLKRKLEIDSSGVATIEYIIPSTDGQNVIKTSYENFADLAPKVFNIAVVTRLNVATYATKFTDQFGQPDQIALKMQVSMGTNAKINWPLKKFSYKDYATLLDKHELNPLLQKDYDSLIKAKKN